MPGVGQHRPGAARFHFKPYLLIKETSARVRRPESQGCWGSENVVPCGSDHGRERCRISVESL
jgi:hypothetical protein